MTPTLTSNSSLLTTTPHSRFSLRNPRLRVFAKKSGSFPSFGLGKPKDDSSSPDDKDTSPNSNPFRLDFGKIPDVTSLIPVPTNNSSPGFSFGNPRRKDPSTVFVAGATGQAGIRIAQTLLREGFSVRAGVSELGSAQELARLAAQYKVNLSLNHLPLHTLTFLILQLTCLFVIRCCTFENKNMINFAITRTTMKSEICNMFTVMRF